MVTDTLGQNWFKVNLHTHTTQSDGARSPDEAARIYREAGYDAIAITDHWVVGEARTLSDLPILAGCEFDVGTDPAREGVFHIVALGYTAPPKIERGMTAKQMISAIHAVGGYAVLAHPEWSLNTVAQITAEQGAVDADASEIYNSVSDCGWSYRADSSAILDRLAMLGHPFRLVAADDTHMYGDDLCVSYLMVRAEAPSADAIMQAIRKGDFYASQGPWVQASVENGQVLVRCSPAVRITFHTSLCIPKDAVVRGKDLTEARFSLDPRMKFVRVSVTDAEGKRAWTSYLDLSAGKCDDETAV